MVASQRPEFYNSLQNLTGIRLRFRFFSNKRTVFFFLNSLEFNDGHLNWTHELNFMFRTESTTVSAAKRTLLSYLQTGWHSLVYQGT